jgi:hypothetical protein
MFNLIKYPQNAVDLVSHRYSLYQTVLLSYSDISRCSLLIKTFPHCLIQATYYHVSTHRLHDRKYGHTFLPTGDNMYQNRNMQIVKVDLPMPRIIAKVIKYVMLAIITGCCIQSALILTEIAQRLL